MAGSPLAHSAGCKCSDCMAGLMHQAGGNDKAADVKNYVGGDIVNEAKRAAKPSR